MSAPVKVSDGNGLRKQAKRSNFEFFRSIHIRAFHQSSRAKAPLFRDCVYRVSRWGVEFFNGTN